MNKDNKCLWWPPSTSELKSLWEIQKSRAKESIQSSVTCADETTCNLHKISTWDKPSQPARHHVSSYNVTLITKVFYSYLGGCDWSMTTRFNAAFNRIPSLIWGQQNCNKSAGRRISLTLLLPFLLRRLKTAAIHTMSCFSFVNAPVVQIEHVTADQSLLYSFIPQNPREFLEDINKALQPQWQGTGKCWEVYYDLGELRLQTKKRRIFKNFSCTYQNSRPTQTSTHLEHQWVHFL